MTADQIIQQIIDWNKDANPEAVRDLLVSRARVADLPKIRAALAPHVSLNEINAADDAIFVIDHL